MTAERRRCVLFFAALFAVTLALRLCHVNILWADEDYHLAAGMQTLDGKLLYRDLWYDKPPLAALGVRRHGRAAGMAAAPVRRRCSCWPCRSPPGGSRAIFGDAAKRSSPRD
jgi:hypothetical protein